MNVSETAIPMRKVPSRAQAMSALLACALAGCAASLGLRAAAGATDVATLTARQVPGSAAAPLPSYVPGWLRSGCADTGDRGRQPVSMSGYSDSLACVLRVNTQTEVDYYRYGSAAQTRAAFSAASAAGLAGHLIATARRVQHRSRRLWAMVGRRSRDRGHHLRRPPWRRHRADLGRP